MYFFDNNLTPATDAELVFHLKQLLTFRGWTVMSSGDGIGTYASSGDCITDPGAGTQGMHNVNAWFRIRQPSGGVAPYAGTREFVFQNRSTGSTGLWNICYSYSAPFTGGSPSATVAPTSSDPVFIWGTAMNAGGGQFIRSGVSGGTYRAHIFCGDASEFFTFGFFAYPNGNGSSSCHFLFDACEPGSYPTAELEPYCIYAQLGCTVAEMIVSQNNYVGHNWSTWYDRGGGSQAYVSANAVIWQDDDSQVLPDHLGGNPYNSKDEAFPLAIARKATLTPIGGWKGFLHMTRWNGTSRGNASTLSVLTSGDRIVSDSVNFPWDGSSPLI